MYTILDLIFVCFFALPLDAMSSNYFSGAGKTIDVIDSGTTFHNDLQLESERCFLSQSECEKDKHGHGTHVVEIIASNGMSSPIGIAPRTRLVSLRVTDTNNQYASSAIVDEALRYVLENHTQFNVVNLSISSDMLFGGLQCDDETKWTRRTAAIVDQLSALNIKVVAATGNDGSDNSISYPACLRNVLAVSANNAWYSNSSPAADMNANGSKVLSTWINGSGKQLDGTSMAAAATSTCLIKLDEAAGKKVNIKIIKWLSEPWKNDSLNCSQLIEDYQNLQSGLEIEPENKVAGVMTTTIFWVYI